MRLGIIGRNPAILQSALVMAESLGHSALGTIRDAEALQWLGDKAIDVLVIGGGVEQPARQRLLDACAVAAVRPLEVFGPDNLRSMLQSLAE